MVTRLYVDIVNRRLVESASSSSPANLPAVFLGDTWRVSVGLFLPTNNFATPLAVWGNGSNIAEGGALYGEFGAQYTLRCAIGTAAAPLVDVASWTWHPFDAADPDTLSDPSLFTFTGEIPLDGAPLAAALLGLESLASELEFEIEGPLPAGAGKYSTILQAPITIHADIIKHP